MVTTGLIDFKKNVQIKNCNEQIPSPPQIKSLNPCPIGNDFHYSKWAVTYTLQKEDIMDIITVHFVYLQVKLFE